MSQLQLFFELGLSHVLDINGYDHVLFLVVLMVSYAFSSWKRVLTLVTLFTIGHCLSLVLSSYGIVSIQSHIIEFLIPITILLTAVYNMKNVGNRSRASKDIILHISTICFGLIHGFGFSTYFKMLTQDDSQLISLLGFALGIEAAQIIVVFGILALNFIAYRVCNVSKRDWIIVMSSIVIGVVLPIIKDNWPF